MIQPFRRQTGSRDKERGEMAVSAHSLDDWRRSARILRLARSDLDPLSHQRPGHGHGSLGGGSHSHAGSDLRHTAARRHHGDGQGEKLFDVQAAAPDRRPSERLRGECESIRRSAAALRAQIVEMDKLKVMLNTHFEEYRNARIVQAEKLVAEQESRVKETASRLKTAEFEQRLHRRLHGKGNSSEFDLARSEYALEGVGNQLELARQASARLQLQLTAARKGLFVGESDGGQERVASRQRVDEIEIQQAGLRARLGELEGKLDELNVQLKSEDEYLAIKAFRSSRRSAELCGPPRWFPVARSLRDRRPWRFWTRFGSPSRLPLTKRTPSESAQARDPGPLAWFFPDPERSYHPRGWLWHDRSRTGRRGGTSSNVSGYVSGNHQAQRTANGRQSGKPVLRWPICCGLDAPLNGRVQLPEARTKAAANDTVQWNRVGCHPGCGRVLPGYPSLTAAPADLGPHPGDRDWPAGDRSLHALASGGDRSPG